MDSEDGSLFIKQLAAFVRSNEKALANALQLQRRDTPTFPERPSTAISSTSAFANALSLGPLNFSSHGVKSAKLALTPHHLFYLLSRFEELGINVGPMKVRLEDLHDSSSSANYVSFLSNTQRSRSHSSDVGSIHSVSSIRSVMSGMSALWASFGIGASISAARTERQKAALEADMKYLYSAFTKIPCLRLAPDWRARLIKGYEEFPFDSAVPLYVFKNVQALEVSNIDFRQFFGWDRMADQLRSLTLKHAGIEDPADILIDIVLDDMDKRRRRTSKSQHSPSIPWSGSHSPRKSPTMSGRELRVGSMAPSEAAVEDGNTSDGSARTLRRQSTDDLSRSLNKDSRPRSNSPSRPSSSRNHTHIRSQQRMRRSGSGSSNSSLSDSWYHHHSRGSSANLLGNTVLPSSKWRFLRHLSLADNPMTSIPASSLAPLSNTLFSLDLSSNLFSQIPDSLSTLTALRALNLSHCMIDSLHSLTRNPLPAITALNLRANRLQSLAGIEKLYPLERLDLRDNRLTDPKELARLTGIPEIREIWVEGNPFARTHKDYRVVIFNLFRMTPGYTEDIVIDGSGPSSSEKRILVDRVPIPESVPVVKPIVTEMRGVDVSKPTVVYSAVKEASVLRKERPVPKAVASEINTTSTRRRRNTKRRIVDLSTSDKNPMPSPVDVHSPKYPINSPIAGSMDGSYKISHVSKTQPSTPLSYPKAHEFGSGAFSFENAHANGPAHADHIFSTSDIQQQDWDASGELYRRKIEALRDKVGEGYLSVLSEESWDANNVFGSSNIPTTTAALLAAHPAHHAPPMQAIHGGHS
ncbi:leucine rich repeat domain-containing protein [Trichoderma breve]|uniref:Leucine rich repeat domain-containing protein n=1 Tax=Trichoderma breve TaxID=2034170 RepID=A0A9W9BBW2_9HYPO|nr:leucine rich repeat domain-containing protein [Trichoderma breve]KAJ4860382.1 leucine rich repeat domain-containing protein [Trichoderma breve]